MFSMRIRRLKCEIYRNCCQANLWMIRHSQSFRNCRLIKQHIRNSLKFYLWYKMDRVPRINSRLRCHVRHLLALHPSWGGGGFRPFIFITAQKYYCGITILEGLRETMKHVSQGTCRESNWVSLHYGRAIAQAVSRWLPTAAAWVRCRVWSSGICGGQSGGGTGFLRILRFALPIFIPPIAPQSSSPIIWGWYNRPEVAAVQGT
jgi:hypothetical protein